MKDIYYCEKRSTTQSLKNKTTVYRNCITGRQERIFTSQEWLTIITQFLSTSKLYWGFWKILEYAQNLQVLPYDQWGTGCEDYSLWWSGVGTVEFKSRHTSKSPLREKLTYIWKKSPIFPVKCQGFINKL